MSEWYILFHESAYFQMLTPIAVLLAMLMLVIAITLFTVYVVKKKRVFYIVGLVLFGISLPIIIDGFVWRNMYKVVSAKTTDEMRTTCENLEKTPLKIHKALYARTCATFLVGPDNEKSIEYYEKYFDIVKKHRLSGENFPGTVIFGLQYMKKHDYKTAIEIYRAYDYDDEKIKKLCSLKKSGCKMKELEKALK